jgi:hypothetical protein
MGLFFSLTLCIWGHSAPAARQLRNLGYNFRCWEMGQAGCQTLVAQPRPDASTEASTDASTTPHLKISIASILCLTRAETSLLYGKAFSQPRHTGPKGLQSRLHGNWPCQNSIQHTPPRFYIDAYSA